MLPPYPKRCQQSNAEWQHGNESAFSAAPVREADRNTALPPRDGTTRVLVLPQEMRDGELTRTLDSSNGIAPSIVRAAAGR
jgi:hypothetical protein